MTAWTSGQDWIVLPASLSQSAFDPPEAEPPHALSSTHPHSSMTSPLPCARATSRAAEKMEWNDSHAIEGLQAPRLYPSAPRRSHDLGTHTDGPPRAPWYVPRMSVATHRSLRAPLASKTRRTWSNAAVKS